MGRRRLMVESLEQRRVLAGSFDLEVSIDEQDASSAPGPELTPNTAFSKIVRVTNTSNQSLASVVVTDDQGTAEAPSDDVVLQQVLQSSGENVALGTVAETFDVAGVRRFVRHPRLPYLYGIAETTNTLAIFNTDSLTLETEIAIGSNPRGLTVSDDGSRLYVAIDPEIVVMNTATHTMLPSLPFDQVRDLVTGPDGHLYALSDDPESPFRDLVRKIDPVAKQVVGTDITLSHGNQMAISPAKDRLYVGDYGYSPASLYQYDITVDPPQLLWESPHGGLSGSNGQHVAISNDGSFISYAAGAGQGGYKIAKYRTSDMVIDGTFDTGAYPREITFSPDDAIAYTVNNRAEIKTWNTTTYIAGDEIDTRSIGEAQELLADRTGQYLFAAFSDRVVAFHTGHSFRFNVGDANSNGLLDPAEQWSFEVSEFAKEGQQQSTVNVSAIDDEGQLVEGDVASYYVGRQVIVDPPSIADVELAVTIDGQNAADAPGPPLEFDTPFEKIVQVTNSGGQPLTSIVAIDDGGTPADSSDDVTFQQVLQSSGQSSGTLGSTAQTFSAAGIHRFTRHPWQPYLYGISFSTNLLSIFNTSTLTLEKEIAIGSNPRGLTVSDDGSRLYVATDPAIVVMDTATHTMLPSLPFDQVRDLVTGADGHLYALTYKPNSFSGEVVRRIDPATGEVVGTDIPISHGSQMAISPAKDRLYVGDYGYSPASLYQFDITVDPPQQLWESPHGGLSGSNGQHVAISNDGSFISYAAGAGQGGYKIAKYRTSDMVIAGTFDTGPYPREITFSPDDTIAYTVNNRNEIKTWDTTTFRASDEINTGSLGEAEELYVDHTGRYLFAAFAGQVIAFNTGRPLQTNIGDVNSNGIFDPQEQWSFSVNRFAEVGQQRSAVKVTAIGNSGQLVSKSIDSFFQLAGAYVDVTASISSERLRVGDEFVIDYSLTNLGSIHLADIEIVDDNGTVDPTDDFTYLLVGEDVGGDGILSPGETWRFESTQVAAVGLNQHQGSISAVAVDSSGSPIPGHPPVTSSASVSYFGELAEVTLQVSSDDALDGSANPPIFADGQTATWKVIVENSGNVPLSEPAVVDDLGTASEQDDVVAEPALLFTHNVGDINRNQLLDPGESWRYQTTRQILPGLNNGRVVVRATAPLNEPFTSTAPFEFIGTDHHTLKESVSGAVVMSPADLVDGIALSDERFELVDGNVQLKPDLYLSHEGDDGFMITLYVSESGDIVHALVIHVQSNPLPWQNDQLAKDTNGDDQVTARDALLVINALGITGTRELTVRPEQEEYFYDANGDLLLSALDALVVINELAKIAPESELVHGTIDVRMVESYSSTAEQVGSIPSSGGRWVADQPPIADNGPTPIKGRELLAENEFSSSSYHLELDHSLDKTSVDLVLTSSNLSIELT